jgi:hypothetical protein
MVTLVAALIMLLAASSTGAGPPVEGDRGSGGIKLAGAVASKISYQGRLTDAGGNPLEGHHNLVFQLWDDAAAGSQVGDNIVRPDVDVRNGLFTVELDVPEEVFTGQALWLRIQVDGQWLAPRQELLPVPYALGLKPGAYVGSADNTTALTASNGGNGYGLYAASAGNVAIYGKSSPWIVIPAPAGMVGVWGYGDEKGVYGSGGTIGVYGRGGSDGVKGESTDGNAVHGISTNGIAVLGDSTAGNGVRGSSSSSYGVVGQTQATDKAGVYGWSNSGKGVEGHSSSDDAWVPAVYGKQQGAGDGVYGWSQNRHGVFGITYSMDPDHAAVYATNSGRGAGLYAGAGDDGYAAILKGNVQVQSKSTGAAIIELGEGLDYAEGFNVSQEAEIVPGTVLVIDPLNPGKLAVSAEAYDYKVAGIATGAQGLGSAVRLAPGRFDCDVALAGRVYGNVDGTYGAVVPGDLLTTSPTPGYAMVVRDHARAAGAILGKAMEPLAEGEKGQILVLVTLQ